MTDLIHHPDTHRLGKAPARPSKVMLADLIDIEKAVATVPVPANIINSNTTPGGPAEQVVLAMYANNQYGDCTFAGLGNKLRTDSNNTVQVTDQDVLTGYTAVTGQEGAAFSAGPPVMNDNGCNELDVLDYAATVGVGGVKILGHAGVNANDDQERRMALYLCGALYDGIQLSTDQQSQQIWQPGPAAAGSWGGHCTILVDEYTQLAGVTIGGVPVPADIPGGFAFALETWGAYKPCAGTYIPFAFDELHAILTDQWVGKAVALGIADEQQIQAFMAGNLTHEN